MISMITKTRAFLLMLLAVSGMAIAACDEVDDAGGGAGGGMAPPPTHPMQ